MIRFISFSNFNLLFSITGIYISYFIFGLHRYMYPRFELFEIFLSLLKLSILIIFLYSIIIFLLNKINNAYIKKIFDNLLFSITFYFLIHFIVRFIDTNLYQVYLLFFDFDNYIIKLLVYGIPLFLGSSIHFFLNKNINNIKKLIFIFLIILNVLIVFRLIGYYSIKNQFNPNNDFKNINLYKKHNKGDNKIIFIIFDEFDYAYLDQQLELFPNIKKIYKSSYVNKNFYAPAEFTIDSIPSILTGSSFKQKIIKNGSISIITDENEKVVFNYNNSLFNLKKNGDNLTTSIFGDVHPYCKILKVQVCYDRYNFQKESLNLIRSLEIFLHISYLEKVIITKKLFRKINKNKSTRFGTFKLVPIGFGNEIDKVMFENTKDFINSDTDIIYIHYPFPKINDRIIAERIVNISDEHSNFNKYQKNLLVVDKIIEKILNSLENYKGSLLIISTDHWLRDKRFKINKEQKIVFMSKIIGDDNDYEDLNTNYSRNIKKLILKYNNDLIKSNDDIKSYFKKNNE